MAMTATYPEIVCTPSRAQLNTEGLIPRRAAELTDDAARFNLNYLLEEFLSRHVLSEHVPHNIRNNPSE